MASVETIETVPRRETALGTLWYFTKRYPLGAAGAVIVTLFVLMAIFAPWITQFDPTMTNSRDSLAPPGGAHPLGADFMGRDMWSRVVYGARISLAVGIGSTGLGCLFGVTIGLTSGYFGGWYDLIVQRFMDMMQSLPLLVMALVMTAALGPSLTNTIIAIAIPLVPSVARVIRSNTLMLREMPFVEASRAVGMNEFAIAIRHVLPNTLAPLIVLATAQLGSTILVEAALSFLGLGVQPPTPSWGAMLTSGRRYLGLANHLAIFPGAAIMLAVMGLNFLGDGLIDALDPKYRKLIR
jgi:peptide/nickel transport system permease protein